jgi:hypothetical protein
MSEEFKGTGYATAIASGLIALQLEKENKMSEELAGYSKIVDGKMVNAERHEFKITNDQQAEDYIEYVNEELTEIRAFKQRLSDKIQQLQMKLEKEEEKEERIIENRNYYLQEYFNSVDDKLKHKTKTQEKYRLPSGVIVKKYSKPKYKRDDEQLIKWVDKNKLNYTETQKKLLWSEFKKDLTAVGDKAVYTPTGEVLDGIKVEYKPETIEFKEE